MSKPDEPRIAPNEPVGQIGQTIRRIAEKRGLTAYAVTKLAGKRNFTEVREFLAGTRDLKLSTIEAICQGLGLVMIEAPQPHEEPKHEPSDSATVEPSGIHQQKKGRRSPRNRTEDR